MGRTKIRAAQEQLGCMWGLGRPLRLSEMGRALRLGGRDPGQTVVRWATNGGPSGPAAVALEMMLAGAPPPDPLSVIVRTKTSQQAPLQPDIKPEKCKT
ncbi:hypothetical protein GCM10007301_12170 [Azorhizobium oxalatiphilum]|uniref:Uncharacterized protein n=1 Tax=Azorhizobium oxalatiphilum TaxID=980631 RepID=A0A917BS05_9HYPH|nr:hypothetical protein [Azorhizobium oxalatiphilum]GGF54223.1 hypothetical protein GCM10007301_12170 [Azorhizobium oxalatiphilum]